MTVGQQGNATQMDGTLTSLALRLRQVMTDLQQLNTQATASGTALAFLQSIGYSPADAQTAATYLTAFAELEQAYFGLANIPAPNNFNTTLAPLWNLQ